MKSKQVHIGDVILIPDKKGEYYVEEAKWGGGGTGHGPTDVYPDGWEVLARRLASDGSYIPHGLTWRFYQLTNCIGPCITEVEVVGKIKVEIVKTYTRIK